MHIKKTLPLIGTLLLTACVSTPPKSSPEVQSALGHYVKNGEIAGVISVLSDKDYNETWDIFGYADVENQRPMAPDTLFAIFSMSKTFTGCAIMCAIDDGVISLDDPVSKFLPEYSHITMKDGKKPKRELTIRDITSHMDGMRSEYPLVNNDLPLRAAAGWYAAKSLSFEPGETFSYATMRFSVAAACLEVATGVPFEKYLQDRVLNPLGMKDTTFRPNADQLKRLVKAYTTKGGKFQPGNDNCCRQLVFPKQRHIEPAPGGGLFSTAQDMIRFSQMLAHHGEWKGKVIVSRETFDKIWAVKQTPIFIAYPYTVGSWLYGDWFGHEGAMRTDQRANLATGDCRVFFIQTENRAGKAFFDAKRDWNLACDKYQKIDKPFSEELVKTVENDHRKDKKELK